jgi:predicted porin
MSAQYYGFFSKAKTSPTRFYKSFRLASLAAAVAVSLPVQAAGPTIYGKLNLSVQQYSFEKLNFAQTTPATTPASYLHTGATSLADELDNTSIESNASRFGIKGDLDISPELKLVYLVEYGIDADNGTNSNGRELTQRNIYAGLKGQWGTLLVGKNDTPLKTLQTNTVARGDIDRFNDAALADIGTYLVGENRPDNVIQYISPSFLGGFEFSFASIQNEESGVAVSPSNPQDDNHLASGYSSALTYGQDFWFVGVAVDNNVAATDAVRLVGEVAVGPVKLGAIYQTAEAHKDTARISPFSTFVGSSVSGAGAQNGLNPISEWDGASGNAFIEQDGYVLNASWKVTGPWTVKAQYGSSTTTPANSAYGDVDITAIALGVDYKLSDAARLYSYYAQLESEGDPLIGTVKPKDSTFALGLDFKF